MLGIPPEELTGLGVLSQPEARLLRLAGRLAPRSLATGRMRLAPSVAKLGELAAVAAELASEVQAKVGDRTRRVLYARTHVRWLQGMVECWNHRLPPNPPRPRPKAAAVPVGAG
jgi:hypothetical protein